MPDVGSNIAVFSVQQVAIDYVTIDTARDEDKVPVPLCTYSWSRRSPTSLNCFQTKAFYRTSALSNTGRLNADLHIQVFVLVY